MAPSELQSLVGRGRVFASLIKTLNGMFPTPTIVVSISNLPLFMLKP